MANRFKRADVFIAPSALGFRVDMTLMIDGKEVKS
jgi:hypothetical protein